MRSAIVLLAIFFLVSISVLASDVGHLQLRFGLPELRDSGKTSVTTETENRPSQSLIIDASGEWIVRIFDQDGAELSYIPIVVLNQDGEKLTGTFGEQKIMGKIQGNEIHFGYSNIDLERLVSPIDYIWFTGTVSTDRKTMKGSTEIANSHAPVGEKYTFTAKKREK